MYDILILKFNFWFINSSKYQIFFLNGMEAWSYYENYNIGIYQKHSKYFMIRFDFDWLAFYLEFCSTEVRKTKQI